MPVFSASLRHYSQSFARRVFFLQMKDPLSAPNICRPGSSSALGRQLWSCGDVRDLALDADPDTEIYAPYQQNVLPYNILFLGTCPCLSTARRPDSLARLLGLTEMHIGQSHAFRSGANH